MPIPSLRHVCARGMTADSKLRRAWKSLKKRNQWSMSEPAPLPLTEASAKLQSLSDVFSHSSTSARYFVITLPIWFTTQSFALTLGRVDRNTFCEIITELKARILTNAALSHMRSRVFSGSHQVSEG